jgi:hypothetical protein
LRLLAWVQAGYHKQNILMDIKDRLGLDAMIVFWILLRIGSTNARIKEAFTRASE